MKAREGDYIETFEGLLFDVKGLVHPPDRIIAFIRYFPDEKGERKRRGTHYGKVYSLPERFALLRERFPHYIVYDAVFDETLCEVPVEAVKTHYRPTERLREMRGAKRLDKLESQALQFAELLKDTGNIPWRNIGVSGSIMVNLHTAKSDIDLVVYGSENCRKAHLALRRLIGEKNGLIKPYGRKELKALFDFRSKDTFTTFEDFVRTELRKVLQGKFIDRDYFIRFVKDWSETNEKYGDVQYKNMGYAKIKATVRDDSEANFSPCTYKIDDVKIVEGSKFEPLEEIASFRGRFCEQARKSERILAQGKIERIVDKRKRREYFRLLLGNRPSDHVILA